MKRNPAPISLVNRLRAGTHRVDSWCCVEERRNDAWVMASPAWPYSVVVKAVQIFQKEQAQKEQA